MSTSKGICFLILATLALAMPSLGAAADVNPFDLKPQMNELASFFKVPASKAGEEPVWAKADAEQTKALTMKEKIRTLPGLEVYDTTNPPMSRHWWNYPLYAFVGCPRDLIDGFFGLLGEVPLLNFPTTGAMYELVPTQMLMRNRHDWHRWPGRRNANDHGWFDGTWGWFSNYYNTTFTHVNQAELDRMETHNREVEQQIAVANSKIDAENQGVAARRTEYLKETRILLDAGNNRAVIQRMLAYRTADPLSGVARGMLVAALVAEKSQANDGGWADRARSDLVWGSPRTVLMPVRDEIQRLNNKRPSAEAARYLVAINMLLENYGQAMESAKQLTAMKPADPTCRALLFEVALAGDDEDAITAAANEVERVAGPNSLLAIGARGRQALVAGKPDQAAQLYLRAQTADPLNPRFHYLEAMSLVGVARKTGKYDKAAVRAELGKAIQYSHSKEEEDFYRQTLEAANAFRAKTPKAKSGAKGAKPITKPQKTSPMSLFGE